jgi:uncharacterized protein YqeY
MTTLLERLTEDQKTAMRAKDSLRLDAIRMVRSALLNAQKAKDGDLTDADGSEVLAREVRQRREAVEEGRKANRSDIVEREEAGLSVVMAYLPEQLSRDDIAEAVKKIIAEVGAKGAGDRGRVMGKLMPTVRGKADGREVSEIVEKLLSQ